MLAGAVWVALAACVSQMAIAPSARDAAYIAVLPLTTGSVLCASASVAAFLALMGAGASLLPLTLLALLFLPLLPFRAPAAFLTWTGPITLIVWMAVLLLMIASIRDRLPRLRLAKRPALVAGLAALVIFGLSAWRVAPMRPRGDEPHYLVITQSLLLDGDLRIENNHARGDYRAYFGLPLRPDYIMRGRDGEIYSIHAPGLAALVLPAFAVAGYTGVVALLVVLAALGSALAWHVVWLATGRTDAAWFGWAAVTLSATAVFQSFAVLPDGVAGLLVLSGAWALLRAERERLPCARSVRPWLLHGAALALLPWLHTRFALLAASLGSLLLLRLSRAQNPAAKAVAFLSVPAVSALLWIGFFILVYGTPDPSAPYGSSDLGSFRWVRGGLGGLFFDQRFGLLVYAPVLACGFIGLGLMLAQTRWRRLSIELLFVTVPYVLTITHYPMWWGGWGAPARFFAPVLTLLAIPCAVVWMSMERRSARVLALAALAFTACASAVLVYVDRGRLAYNLRDTPALWLEWLGRGVDLVGAAPSWTRSTDVPLFRTVAVWLAGFAIVWIVLRLLETVAACTRRVALATSGAWMIALVAMTAMSVIWHLERRDGRNVVAAQVNLLRTVAVAPSAAAVDVGALRRIAKPNVAGRLSIELTRELSDRRSARDDRPIFSLPSLPAGEYRLTPVASDAGGLLTIGVGRDQFAFRMDPVASPPAPIDIALPAPVRGLTVRADEDARQTVRGLILEPLSLLPPTIQSLPNAQHAVRYGSTTVFFLDDRGYAEPKGFWVGGGASTRLVICPDVPRSSVRVHVRNAPVDNDVSLVSGAWRVNVPLTPREERGIDIPLDRLRRAAYVEVTARTGSRPADYDAESADARVLGVWIQVE